MEQRTLEFDKPDVLKKFSKVKVKNDRLSPGDRAAVDKFQKEYNEIRENLDNYHALFENLHETDGAPGHEISSWHHNLMYSPLDGINKIDSLQKKAQREFIEQIIRYFNSKYHLDIEGERLIKDEIHSEDVLNYIFTNTNYILGRGGHDLRERGEEKLKKDFRHKIYRKEKLKIQRYKITLKKYLRLTDEFSRNLRIAYNYTKDADLLFRVISFFEFENLDNRSMLAEQVDGKEVNTDGEYVDNGSGRKLVGLHLYKNGNVVLRFASPDLAREFWNIFELDYLR